jgi:hypothetical protein
MSSPVSFQLVRAPLTAEASAEAEAEAAPKDADATGTRSFGSAVDTPRAPSVPPWLTPDNFDFLRRVAQVVSPTRG